MLLIQLHKISCNFQNMLQLFEIYHTTQEGCIFFGNMYNGLRSVIGVVPGCTLLVGKVCGKGENILGRGNLTESLSKPLYCWWLIWPKQNNFFKPEN